MSILGDEFEVNADVEILDSFSGHADHDELLGWFDRVQGQKKRVFLVHGEPERSSALKAALDVQHTTGSVEVAVLNQQVEL